MVFDGFWLRARRVLINGMRPQLRFRWRLNRAMTTACQISGTPWIVFADDQYQLILENWLAFAERAQIRNVLVVCYDKRLFRRIKSQGISCVWLPMKKGKEFLWWRLLVFRELCARGINFVHCDADAILLRHPEEHLGQFEEIDLIISPGTVHPREIAQEHLFVLCMGFFRILSNERTQSLLSEAIRVVSEEKTDQAAVNRLVFARVQVWRHWNENYEIKTHRGVDFIFNESYITSEKSDGLSVVVLPHSLFQRFYSGMDFNPVLIHPLANQTAETKFDTLNGLNLWDSSVKSPQHSRA